MSSRCRKPPKTDLTGMKFGFLEVLRMEQRPQNGWQYYAICRCLNCNRSEYAVIPGALRRGYTTSCGCRRDQYAKVIGERNSRFTGYKEIRGKWWSSVVRLAHQRKLEVSVSLVEIWDMFENQGRKCKLSGIDIRFDKYSGNTTASLDRIDNSVGYVLSNVQLVHKTVNWMKYRFSQNQFIDFCRHIAKYSRKANRPETSSCNDPEYKIRNLSQFKGYEEIRGTTYAKIKNKAMNRGYSFGLDIADLWGLYLAQNRKCALSGILINFGVAEKSRCTTASLDRIDSSIPYILSNVQWVHKQVNLMKNKMNENEFVKFCKLITKWNT